MTVLDPLDEAALIRVLTEPKNSIVRQYKELFSLDNAELVFTDDALHEVAQRTIERKSAARVGLRSVVEELLIPIMYDIPSDPTIVRVTIDRDTVRGGKPHIEYGAARQRYKDRNTGSAVMLAAVPGQTARYGPLFLAKRGTANTNRQRRRRGRTLL